MGRFKTEIIFVVICCVVSAKAVGFAEELYCGLENCYEVLAINRDEFDKATLPKIYRAAARMYHPDRVRDPDAKADAERKFRLIATAYETLKDEEIREEYNYYLDHPEERFYNYYQYYRRRVAPKVDVRIVIVGTMIAISVFQYWAAKSKYAEALAYALTVGKFRNQAIFEGLSTGQLESQKNGKLKKVKGRDNEKVIKEIIERNMDIRGGYKRESVFDTLIWKVVILPITIYNWGLWYSKWIWSYWIKRLEYDEKAKLYLIRKKMDLSEAQFACISEEELDEYLSLELWIDEKFKQWKTQRDEEEREKLAKSGKHKRYRRWLKHNEGSTISFLDEDFE